MSINNLEDIYTLTSMQQGMLFHSQYMPGSQAYFCQASYALQGRLDTTRFQEAWQQVMDHHAVLRTSFHWEHIERPVQVVHRQKSLLLQEFDWRDVMADRQQQDLEAFLKADREKGFELTQAPLIRLALIRLTNTLTQMILSHHHILMDGWSVALVLKEVLKIYEARIRGQEPVIETARPFRDYIAWLQQQDRSQQETYWKEYLKGFSTPTQFPLERLFEGEIGLPPDYAIREMTISPEATKTLTDGTRQHKITLNTLIQGAWALLLSRYSGEEDVLFGTTVSGRPASLADVENMVGLFVNTLPLRIQIDQDAAVLPWLEQIQRLNAELRQYQDSALQDIQSWSEIPRGNPLFDTLFVFENYPIDPVLHKRVGELEVTDVRFFEQTDYPITLTVVPGDCLLLRVTYDLDRFASVAMERMLDHLRTLLHQILLAPGRQLCDVPLLPEAEHQAVIVDFNATIAEYPRNQCIHSLFESQAAFTPHRVAVKCGGEHITYAELDQRTNYLARALQALGVGPEVRVGLCMDRSISMVVGLLGILKAGGAYVPLDPGYPRQRLAFILNDAEISLLITRRDLCPTLPEQNVHIFYMEEQGMPPLPIGVPRPVGMVVPDNLAYIIYTSGSTGIPKGVAITHRSAVALLHWGRGIFAQEDIESVLASTSVCFDLSIFELFLPLSWGGTVILVEDLFQLPGLINQYQVTLINTVPSVLMEFLRTHAVPASVRTMNLAGEPLPIALVEQLYRHTTIQRVYDLYGPSETTTYSTFALRTRHGDTTIGRPIANTQVYLLDRYLHPVPIGIAGELHIGGEGLARGYLNRADLTAERFVPDPFCSQPGARLYRTGDLARYRSDGNLEFLGRRDHQVKVRGFRIELGEVEAILRQHPSILESVVVAREASPGEKRLIAYFVPHRKPAPAVSELRRFLKGQLPEYMIPAAFVALDALPLTPNGKVDRKALPAPDPIRSMLKKEYLAPRTWAEKALADIWEQILGLEQVGIEDNFFELGGDSLLSLRVSARAKQVGLELTPKQIFQHPTILELAATSVVGSALEAEQESAAGPLPMTRNTEFIINEEMRSPGRWTLALTEEVPSDLDTDLLKQVIHYLMLRHDALRLRIQREESGWRPYIARPDEDVPFSSIDISLLPNAEQELVMQARLSDLMKTLSLTQGPILGVDFCYRGPHKPATLLFALHHISIDDYAVTLLIDEFEMAYAQLSRGERIQLPPRTTSFRRWAEQLQIYSASEEARQEATYWRELPWQQVPLLPPDYARGPNISASECGLTVALTVEETHKLLRQVPTAYGAEIMEMLLTALGWTLTQWLGKGPVSFSLMVHGRNDIFEGINVSRTVGWISTVYAVLLQLGECNNPAEALVHVRKQLRSMPHYGITQSSLPDLDVIWPQVYFNYLGNRNRGWRDAFKLSHSAPEPELDLSDNRTCGSGHLTYTFPGLTSGENYLVRLHFVESSANREGERLFDVTLNGNLILMDLDIFQATGGKNRAIVREFGVAADTDGRIVLAFISKTGCATIHGIEIFSEPLSDDVAADRVSAPDNKRTRISDRKAVYQINAGGPTILPFSADEHFTEGLPYTHDEPVDISLVPDPAPTALYQTGRLDLGAIARFEILHCTAYIVSDRFEIVWRYSENLHRRSTIEQLANCYLDLFRWFIDHADLVETDRLE